VHLPCDAARIRAAPHGQNVPCPSRFNDLKYARIGMSFALSPSELSRHVDVDNIRYWQCPYFGWRDRSMITEMNNSKLATHNPDTYHHGDLRRALVQAALELAAEEKDWNFSLREVARRAGVSHNAPYNHFPHKRDLLDAAAAAGHDLLRSELTAAVAKIADPRAALSKLSSAYVSFGLKNPALYHLMFRVAPSGPVWRPEEVLQVWVAARAVLENILRRGARIGIFDPALTRKPELQTAALYTWAVIHGLTMLAIDGLANVEHLSIERIAQKVITTTLRGLAGSGAPTNGSTK
jgi:AcrR family transcriptional regulator